MSNGELASTSPADDSDWADWFGMGGAGSDEVMDVTFTAGGEPGDGSLTRD